MCVVLGGVFRMNGACFVLSANMSAGVAGSSAASAFILSASLRSRYGSVMYRCLETKVRFSRS